VGHTVKHEAAFPVTFPFNNEQKIAFIPVIIALIHNQLQESASLFGFITVIIQLYALN
jgi:hypothetical protein